MLIKNISILTIPSFYLLFFFRVIFPEFSLKNQINFPTEVLVMKSYVYTLL